VLLGHDIAQRFNKSMVVINTYDPVHQRMHTTTYGELPEDKELAATIGMAVSMQFSDVTQERATYQDYRFIDEGTRARKIELLSRAAIAAESLLAICRKKQDQLIQAAIDSVRQRLLAALEYRTEQQPVHEERKGGGS
jgi:hypothetical protein